MKKRSAKKILKELAGGRSYKTWRKGTLYKASDTLYGRSNRGMIGMLLFSRATLAVNGFGRQVLAFAEATAKCARYVSAYSEAVKAVKDGVVYRRAMSPHRIQGPSYEITPQNLK